jgi:hypothetical protein
MFACQRGEEGGQCLCHGRDMAEYLVAYFEFRVRDVALTEQTQHLFTIVWKPRRLLSGAEGLPSAEYRLRG